MVLLPGCICCDKCDEPFKTLGAPTSIEVDIVQDDEYDYAFTGVDSFAPTTITASAYLPPLTGTYSLSPVSGYSGTYWRYEDATILIEFSRQGGSSPYQNLFATPKIAFQGLAVAPGTTQTKTQTGGMGGQILRNCNASKQTKYQLSPWFGVPYSAEGIVGNLVSGPSVGAEDRAAGQSGSFVTDCRLPMQIEASSRIRYYQANGRTWTESSNTFPGYSTVPSGFLNLDTIHYYHFDYSFTVSACRLVYASQTLGHMDDLSPVSCVAYP